MELNANNVWSSVCGELEIQMSPASFSGWVKPCFIRSLVEIDSERLLVELATTSIFHRKTVDEKYFALIKQTMEKITNKKCEIALVIEERKTDERSKSQQQNSKTKDEVDAEEQRGNVSLFHSQEESKSSGNLKSNYTFESFVVGGSNRLAFAAGKAVSDNPGVRHNPLFIYGGVGVGKTHLMHAVGHELIKKNVGKVVYLTSEQFTNDLVSSLRSKMTEAFKKKYRQVGALLIDDIQFFAGKESTQEEFFHTFNELTMNNKQIIMTSDKKPQDIQGLEDRLVSRFLGGMTVDIGLPDYEMRQAILRQKAFEIKAEVDDEVFDLIANTFNSNTRELEGTFVRLVTMANIGDGKLTKEMVQQTMGLPKTVSTKEIKVRPIKVVSTVAKYFDYRNKDLLGTSRKADLVIARHIAMYILRETMKLPLTEVGEVMGGRDHTTIMHAAEKIKTEIEGNADMRRKVMAVTQALYT